MMRKRVIVIQSLQVAMIEAVTHHKAVVNAVVDSTLTSLVTQTLTRTLQVLIKGELQAKTPRSLHLNSIQDSKPQIRSKEKPWSGVRLVGMLKCRNLNWRQSIEARMEKSCLWNRSLSPIRRDFRRLIKRRSKPGLEVRSKGRIQRSRGLRSRRRKKVKVDLENHNWTQS